MSKHKKRKLKHEYLDDSKTKRINNKISDNKDNKDNKVILIVVFVVAVLTRIYNDSTIPYHYDPGKNIVFSRAILDTFPLFPQYNPYFNLGEYYEYQVLFPYIVALFHKITGLPLVDLTAVLAIIIGSLMVVTVYLLSKEIFNNEKFNIEMIALISAGLIAVSKIQLFSYMNYYPQILGMTLLPLSFMFLIRYTRTLDKKYLVYASILSGAIILSSYLTGMVYISILALSLIIYSIVKKDLRYTYVLMSIITLTTALIAFYILPIINRYGIKSFINGIINTIFTPKDIPFTNPNIQSDTTLLEVFSFLTIIVLILGIALIIYLYNRKSKLVEFNKIKYEHILLFVWILISIILVESYKFRPVLWVDRYIEILDISITILTGYAIYFILDKIKKNKYLKTNYKLISALILMCIFAYPVYDVIKPNYRFGYWSTPNDLVSLNWIYNNIPSESLFIAPGGITSFWISALGGVHVLGGESSQMLGENFDGNSYSDVIINSPNIDEKMRLIREFGVNYIYLTIRPGIPLLWRNDYNIEGLKAFGDEKYFESIYQKEDRMSVVYILKVKENLVPKYNIPKIDKNITILGYIISIMTMMIMLTIIRNSNKENSNKYDKREKNKNKS